MVIKCVLFFFLFYGRRTEIINTRKDIRQAKNKKQHQHLEINGFPFSELSKEKNIPCGITDCQIIKACFL